jgi:DNA-binding MarR family transcriptional regulator
MLRKFELTPARFDVLYVVQRSGPHGVLQSKIWETLGLHKSTISKMCKRLEELGFIERMDALGRFHNVLVRLTKEGVIKLGLAMRWVFADRGPRFVMRALMFGIEHTVAGVDDFIAKLRRNVHRAARNLGDDSTLLYPLHQPSQSTLDKVLKRLQNIHRVRCEDQERKHRMNRPRTEEELARIESYWLAVDKAFGKPRDPDDNDH